MYITELKEVSGFYGSGETPCTVLVAVLNNGRSWYCVDGSVNVNCTEERIEDGVNVETLADVDMFTSNFKIDSLKALETAVYS